MKEVYAFKNCEEEVLKSSSGGAYIAICNAFEKEFGKDSVSFYGATYDNDLTVIHKRVSSAKECKIFQGSKYVKSNHTIVFKDIENDIKNNINILFSGTPCQVSAIKNYLKSKKRLLSLFT